jgi:hypothetical protein
MGHGRNRQAGNQERDLDDPKHLSLHFMQDELRALNPA